MGVTINTKELLDGLNGLLDIPEIKKEIEDLGNTDFGPKWFVELFDIVEAAVKVASELADQIGVGLGEKEKDAIAEWMDDVVVFTGLFSIAELWDKGVFRAAVDVVFRFFDGVVND